MTLENSVAVVMGGTRGVDRAIADGLAGAGVRAAAVGRTAERYRADVSDHGSVEELRELIERELGAPSILVNAARVFGPIALVKDSDPNGWIRTVMVDLVGSYLTCRAFAPAMIDAGWAPVINVTSASSLHPPGILSSAYGTSKTASCGGTNPSLIQLANVRGGSRARRTSPDAAFLKRSPPELTLIDLAFVK